MTTATNTSLGEIKLAGDLTGNNGLAPELTATGVVPGSYIVPTITVDTKGRITSAAATSGAAMAAIIQSATTSQRGVIQLGANLIPNVNNPNIIDVPIATETVPGVVKIGTGLVLVNGAITHTPVIATSSTTGMVKIGSGISVDGSGSISIDMAVIPSATTTVKGIVNVPAGTGLSVTNGVLSTVDATTSTKGVVQIGTGLSVASGVVSLNQDATTSTKGVVQIGTGLSVASGVVSISDATTSTKGVVQIGTGLSVTGGVLSTVDATTSTKGVVQIGTGLSVTGGVVSLNQPAATTTSTGAVQVGVGFKVTGGGIISVDSEKVALFDTGGTFNAAIVSNRYDLTDAPTVTPDFTNSNLFSLSTTQNFTLANPTNVVAGGVYFIGITQDAVGSRVITWGSNFKFNGAAPVLSTAANAIDLFKVVVLSYTTLLTTKVGSF